jgi:hypothetical protein
VRSDQWKVGGSVCVNVEPTAPILFIVATGASHAQLSLMRVRMATLTLLHQRVRKIVEMTVFTTDPLMFASQRKASLVVRKLYLCPTGSDVTTATKSRSRGALAFSGSQNGRKTTVNL